MARSRGMSLRPINSQKHEQTFSNLAQNASSGITITVIKGTERGGIATATPEEVQIGAKITSVFFEFNLNGVDNSGSAQVIHWMVFKNPQGTFSPNPLLYNENTKRHILKRGMEMLPEIPLGSGGTVQTKRVFVVKIPRGLQRFGDDDTLEFIYRSSSASSINICGFMIYKEIT